MEVIESWTWVLVFLPLLPLLVVWAVGIAIAIGRWRQHPRVSLLTVIGLVMVVVAAPASTALSTLAPLLMRERDWSATQIGLVFAGFWVITSVINAVAWALILAALFGCRERRPVV
jgi:hypothetical protein